MSVVAWRALLLTICAICIGINAGSLFTDAVEASTALTFAVSPTHDNALVVVDGVDAGGAAEKAGLLAGDTINVRALSASDRYRILTGVAPHEQLDFVAMRDGRAIPIRFTAGDAPIWRWDIWLWCFGSFWMLAFATIIAWRRADNPQARILCMMLALAPAYSGLLPGAWLTPSAFADAIAAGFGCVLTFVAAALLATYATMIARPPSPLRRVLTLIAYVSCAGAAAYEIYRIFALWSGAIPWYAQSVGPDWNSWYAGLPWLLSTVCAVVALVDARGEERSRSVWIVAPLSVLYLAQTALFFVPALLAHSQPTSALTAAYSTINVGTFLAPLGMTYALFNRRVLDIKFALNRVAIFSGVSIIVVGLFMLAEYALGSWLQSTSHTTSLIVGAVLALALGFSVRFVHDKVERVLDLAFFRKRHENEEAIRRFAREAAYINDAEALRERTIEVLEHHADASSVQVTLAGANGDYGTISENDPAILSLRTWHRPLDLHTVHTQFNGEWAYPMISRGRLVGVLVLGAKNSLDSYAPDESSAIEDVAQQIGNTLDVLDGRSDGDAVLAELKAMRKAITDGFSSLRART